MVIKKEEAVHNYIKDKEALEVLNELSKEELIERHIYKCKKSADLIVSLLFFALLLGLLLISSIYINVCLYELLMELI